MVDHILQVASIVTAITAILGTCYGIISFCVNKSKEEKEIVDEVKELEEENKSTKQEMTLIIFGLRACLDGLHQQGCNGKVTEAIDKVDKYINKKAHDEV